MYSILNLIYKLRENGVGGVQNDTVIDFSMMLIVLKYKSTYARYHRSLLLTCVPVSSILNLIYKLRDRRVLVFKMVQ